MEDLKCIFGVCAAGHEGCQYREDERETDKYHRVLAIFERETKVPRLLEQIMKDEETDDLRDLFQHLHNYGYNTDFTYNGKVIYPSEGATVAGYLEAYIKADDEEEE